MSVHATAAASSPDASLDVILRDFADGSEASGAGGRSSNGRSLWASVSAPGGGERAVTKESSTTRRCDDGIDLAWLKEPAE